MRTGFASAGASTRRGAVVARQPVATATRTYAAAPAWTGAGVAVGVGAGGAVGVGAGVALGDGAAVGVAAAAVGEADAGAVGEAVATGEADAADPSEAGTDGDPLSTAGVDTAGCGGLTHAEHPAHRASAIAAAARHIRRDEAADPTALATVLPCRTRSGRCSRGGRPGARATATPCGARRPDAPAGRTWQPASTAAAPSRRLRPVNAGRGAARANGPAARLRASGDALQAVARNRDLARLEFGWIASVAADWTYVVAVMVAAYADGGAAAVGGVGFVRMLVATVTAPLVAGLAGHVNPRSLLVGMAITRILAVAAAGLVVAAGGPPIALLVSVALESGAFATHRPIQAAMVPALAHSPEELIAANVASSSGESIGTFIGPALGGFAYAAAGAVVASALVVAILVSAAAAIAPIALVALPESARDRIGTGLAPSIAAAFRASASQLGRGVAVVRRQSAARTLLAVFGAQVVVRGVLNVLLVVASFRLLGLGEQGVGLLTSAIGLGGFVGALGAMALVSRTRLAGPVAVTLVLWGLPIAVMGLLPVAPAAVGAMFVVGVANAALDVSGFTLLQRIVANDARPAVMGLLEGVAGVGVAAGSVIGPVLVGWLGPTAAIIATGAILPVVSLASWPVIRRADDEAVVPVHELGLLRSLPFFAPLPLTALEQIACRMQPVLFEPGDEITHQGDPGDCFYLIDDGAVEVVRDGVLVASVGPASSVGEIALLRRVPRTATVRAVRPTRAFALTGPDFIAAVTASPRSAAAADEVVRVRTGA